MIISKRKVPKERRKNKNYLSTLSVVTLCSSRKLCGLKAERMTLFCRQDKEEENSARPLGSSESH